MEFDNSFVKISWKIGKLWGFECFQMGCYGGSHIVGFVTSHILIKYA